MIRGFTKQLSDNLSSLSPNQKEPHEAGIIIPFHLSKQVCKSRGYQRSHKKAGRGEANISLRVQYSFPSAFILTSQGLFHTLTAQDILHPCSNLPKQVQVSTSICFYCLVILLSLLYSQISKSHQKTGRHWGLVTAQLLLLIIWKKTDFPHRPTTCLATREGCAQPRHLQHFPSKR